MITKIPNNDNGAGVDYSEGFLSSTFMFNFAQQYYKSAQLCDVIVVNAAPPVPAFSVVPISKRGLNVTWYPSQGGLVYASGTIFNVLYRKRGKYSPSLACMAQQVADLAYTSV